MAGVGIPHMPLLLWSLQLLQDEQIVSISQAERTVEIFLVLGSRAAARLRGLPSFLSVPLEIFS